MQRERGSKNVVGSRIAELRASSLSPLTQDALSGRLAKAGLQLDRAAIAKIETGKRYVLDYELEAIAEVLADLLANFAHLCDRKGLNLAQLLIGVREVYAEETNDQGRQFTGGAFRKK